MMKTQMKNAVKSSVFFLFISLAIFSCQENDTDAIGPENKGIEDALEKKVTTFLDLRTDMQSMKERMPNVGGGSFSMNAGTSSGANMRRKSTLEGDSTSYPDDFWEWESCAEITETENPDGTVTITVDYGDGCYEGYGAYDDFKIFMFGAYSETFLDEGTEDSIFLDFTSGTFSGILAYDNFGHRDEYMSHAMTGESAYTHNYEVTFSEDGAFFSEKSLDTFKESLKITTIFEEETEEADMTSDVEEEFYYEEGGESYLQVNKADYTYETEFDVYSSTVITPLVMKWGCYEEGDDEEFWVYIYVSGIEEITYNGEKFTIDYGDGTCDNIITITDEDGNQETIDLDEEYDDYEEDEDGE